ncbi:MAG: ABC transporter permease, partial [Thermomonas sp.]
MMHGEARSIGGPLRDPAFWMVLPAALFMLAVFVYPFLDGLWLSFNPVNHGGAFANYIEFYNKSSLWLTIATTMKLALPATLINVGIAVPLAYRLRHRSRYQKVATTILTIPLTLGTVLIAEGMLTYFGPRGWFSQAVQALGLYEGPVHLTHNYWGVLISLVISGFPFAFLLILSYITGIDPVLSRAA